MNSTSSMVESEKNNRTGKRIVGKREAKKMTIPRLELGISRVSGERVSHCTIQSCFDSLPTLYEAASALQQTIQSTNGKGKRSRRVVRSRLQGLAVVRHTHISTHEHSLTERTAGATGSSSPSAPKRRRWTRSGRTRTARNTPPPASSACPPPSPTNQHRDLSAPHTDSSTRRHPHTTDTRD